jgi:hypothetical protein
MTISPIRCLPHVAPATLSSPLGKNLASLCLRVLASWREPPLRRFASALPATTSFLTLNKKIKTSGLLAMNRVSQKGTKPRSLAIELCAFVPLRELRPYINLRVSESEFKKPSTNTVQCFRTEPMQGKTKHRTTSISNPALMFPANQKPPPSKQNSPGAKRT